MNSCSRKCNTHIMHGGIMAEYVCNGCNVSKKPCQLNTNENPPDHLPVYCPLCADFLPSWERVDMPSLEERERRAIRIPI